MGKAVTVTITKNGNKVHAQTTNSILMIEPVSFAFNRQTAKTNYFQQRAVATQPKALAEFRQLVTLLEEHGVNVITMKDTLLPHSPSAIFAAGATSFHDDGRAFLYPMAAPNRRVEIDIQMLHDIKPYGFTLREIFDMRPMADSKVFLEGASSMVFDRNARVAYACRSSHTDEKFLKKTCKRLNYEPVLFTAKRAVGWKREPIHHTNLMMTIAERFVIICLDALTDEEEKQALLARFKRAQKAVINISEKQMLQFAGNAKQLQGRDGKRLLVMSTRAYDSLTPEQIDAIETYCPIIHSDISTIEDNGGAGVGAMIAEIFLPRRKVIKRTVSV